VVKTIILTAKIDYVTNIDPVYYMSSALIPIDRYTWTIR